MSTSQHYLKLQVDGPDWDLTFRSTYAFDDCPPSDIVITQSPTLMPTEMPSSSPSIFNASGLETFPPATVTVEGNDEEGMDALYRGLIGGAVGVGLFLVFLALFCCCYKCFVSNNKKKSVVATRKGKDLENGDTEREYPNSP